jgi:hypothetical protein
VGQNLAPDRQPRSSSTANETAAIGQSFPSACSSEHYSTLLLFWPRHLLLDTSLREDGLFLVAIFTMALRLSCSRAARRATITPATSIFASYSAQWTRGNATVAPTQVTPGSKGPTAMVFMNMGGPSTTDEVHGFLSMLFVCGLVETHHGFSAYGV